MAEEHIIWHVVIQSTQIYDTVKNEPYQSTNITRFEVGPR